MVEHYDKYFDDYLRANIAGQYIPEYFGPSPPNDRGPLMIFRAYFTDVDHFESFGESYAIKPLVVAMFELNEMLLESLGGGSRFPRRQ